jgi:hypothetical protein
VIKTARIIRPRRIAEIGRAAREQVVGHRIPDGIGQILTPIKRSILNTFNARGAVSTPVFPGGYAIRIECGLSKRTPSMLLKKSFNGATAIMVRL